MTRCLNVPLLLACSTIFAHTAQAARPVVYDCKWGTESARLNFTDHIATYAGADTDLNDGIVFNFKTPSGTYTFDVGFSMDVIYFDNPPVMSGVVTLTMDHEGPPTPVRCTLRR